ncbi:MAG: OmpA family protein [Bacteroidetes bacterium]|nr:OmpA family protein [Bacteroidota bacterium]
MVNKILVLSIFFGCTEVLSQQLVSAPFHLVNSKYDEQNPVVGPGALFLTVANHPQNVGGKKDPGDIWISLWVDGRWNTPVHGGYTLNDANYNAVAGFSPDGNQLFLLGHYGKKGNLASTQGISVSKRIDDGWSSPENISIPYFMNRSQHFSGSMNPAGNVLLFSAESYGTIGAEDIYVSVKQAGKWGEPINLGATINTRFQEYTPSLSYDGKTIYFSSNGLNGEGGFDVYQADKLDSTWKLWSAPKPIDSPPNTEARELFYRTSAKGMALFTTTQNSDGYGDIRAWVDTLQKKINEPMVVLRKGKVHITGKITNSKSGATVAAEIVFQSDSLYRTQTSSDGNYVIDVPANYKFNIEVSAKGFVNLTEQASLENFKLTSLSMDFKIQPIEIGTVVNLKNILFYIGTTSLLEDSYPELNSIVSFLKANPKIEIELEGHTDNRGDPKKNLILSQQRVDAIKNYLVSRGVRSKRIKGKGFGGTRPVSTDDTEEAHKLNRRVEFVILKD